jgi:putative tryptophan/tyrosine transport system substrate-binding protein
MRLIGLAVILGLTLAPLAVEAQQAGRMPRIGVVFPAEPASPTEPSGAAFRQGLRDLGYVEGQNVAVEYRYALGRTERYSELVGELVQLKVDVLVAGGNSSFAAKKATQTIPIVSIAAGDILGTGLVTSFARPGGNLTGLSMAFDEGISQKWVQLLKEVAPRVSRVGLLRDASVASRNPRMLTDTAKAAAALGLTFQVLDVRALQELDGIFAELSKKQGYGLVVGGTPLLFPDRSRIHELAIKYRLPIIYGWRVFVDAGGLMSYGASLSDLWRRAAIYVDKILKGAKPADLPIEEPTKFELVINLKTAKALGLTIPQSVLLRADEIIQ